MSGILRFRTGPEDAGLRLDRWLAGRFPDHSRTRMQAWIRDGRIRVDGEIPRSSLVLAPGQQVEVDPPAPEPSRLEPVDIPLQMLFEDEDVAVLVKPAGLQVHPGAGPPRPTLAQALLHRWSDWHPPGSPERPGIVHRLDRDTSGLMLVARSERAYQALIRGIQAREISRRYITLVWGRPEDEGGEIDASIGRSTRDRRRMTVRREGKPAQTYWRLLRRFDTLSLLDIVLGTGRTHQVRVHCRHMGHPVFGDPTYGGNRGWLARSPAEMRPRLEYWLRRLNRQALHAYHLAFRHPVGGAPMRFEAPVPGDMDRLLSDLIMEDSTR